MTLRVDGAENMRPYPGLASFTAADAEFFFGREAEVETLWKKLQRPHLLGLIGPSGAGKSSFLHAGLLPAQPEGWRYVSCQPDDAPFRSLAQALMPDLAGDLESMQELLRFEELDTAVRVIARWRAGADEALIIVDQFEELFTLNPPETQRRFSELLGRLPLEADVRVLLSMRDDFLLRCHEHPALAPLFSELTPLHAPSGAALRRALVQPALACGYRFETEALVDEMLGEVAEERGALPLLAFAASRLWEKRDRQEGTLTRAAYEDVGGVSGALAQHAEATLESLGAHRREQVREIFRNLVTIEGTRATRKMSELMSVFDEPEAAREVVNALIDARLLTSYEVPGDEGEADSHRVEIVHESLLAAWPRLVRWQTQDADGAQLRDQVRQASKVWEDRGRPDDLLWTGTSWREHQLWRERYPGGLSAAEEAFSRAMGAKAARRKLQRRVVLSAIFASLVVVLLVFGTLWRQSDEARLEAIAQTRRAEASKLLALGQLEFGASPTAAVAYALASLELADTPAARRFALKALWQGPTAITLEPSVDRPYRSAFSPNGQWLVVGGYGGEVALYSRNGGAPKVFDAHGGRIEIAGFAPASDRFATYGTDYKLRIWSVTGGKALQTIDLSGEIGYSLIRMPRSGYDLVGITSGGEDSPVLVKAWSLDGGEPQILGKLELSGPRAVDLDADGERLVYAEGKRVLITAITELATGTPRLVGEHDADITNVRIFAGGERVAVSDRSGEIRIWSLTAGARVPLRVITVGGEGAAEISKVADTSKIDGDAQGSWLSHPYLNEILLWRLNGPPDAEPLILRPPGGSLQINDIDFDPSGQWLLTTNFNGVTLWPLAGRHSTVLKSPAGMSHGIAVAPDGSWVAGLSTDGYLWVFPLTGSGRAYTRPVGPTIYGTVAAHPDGRHVLVGTGSSPGLIYLVPVSREGEVRIFKGFKADALTTAVSADGRLVAASGGVSLPEEGVIRIWDLESGAVQVLDPGDRVTINSIAFTPDGRLISGGAKGVRIWNLADGSSTILRKWTENMGLAAVSGDGKKVLSAGFNFRSGNNGMVLHDLESGESRPLVGFGKGFGGLDERGEWVLSGDQEGVARIGPVSSEEPHLLLGHKQSLLYVGQFMPDGKRVITTDMGGTLRIWEIPQGRPFHTLPLAELLARLRALTNMRVARDEDSATGYVLKPGPFPGWEKVPTW